MSIKVKITYIHGETMKELSEIAFDYNELSNEELIKEIKRGYIKAYTNQPRKLSTD